MRSSEHLRVGDLYTRAELKRRFSIADATINTGVFRPAGHDSIWLFVTRFKEADRIPYDDRLEGDELLWQGQLQGRTDHLIIEHQARGLELLVFYREHRRQHPGAAFTYEGRFEYTTHRGTRPASFRLRRAP